MSSSADGITPAALHPHWRLRVLITLRSPVVAASQSISGTARKSAASFQRGPPCPSTSLRGDVACPRGRGGHRLRELLAHRMGHPEHTGGVAEAPASLIVP
jgi:hypothetical protein